MIRPGTGSTSGWGRNTVWSTPTGTTVIRSSSTPICAAMSTFDDSETVTTRGRAPGHLDLHPEEAEPAPLGELLPRVGGGVG